MTAARRSTLLTLLPALALAACSQTDIIDEKDLSQEGWVGNWDIVAKEHAGNVGADLPPIPTPIFLGKHLALHLISVPPGDVLRPPLEPADEALIVVEGAGFLQPRTRLEAGSVGLFPRGTRRTIKADPRKQLLGLLIRSRAKAKPGAAAPGTPHIVGIEDYLTPALTKHQERLARKPLGAIPGGLSVTAISVRGLVERHVHLRHDEVVFVLRGRGDFGLGTWGKGSGKQSKRGWRTSPIREQALLFIPQDAPHEFQNTDQRTVAISVFGPDFKGQDRYRVPDKKKKLAPERKVVGPKRD